MGGPGRALGSVPAIASKLRLAKQESRADDERDGWEYVRDPLHLCGMRIPHCVVSATTWRAEDTRWQFAPELIADRLSPAIRRVQLNKVALRPDYGARFNPFLRCIVRRTRGYLENMINPATGSYFLPKVSARLFGEEDESALNLRWLSPGSLSGSGAFLRTPPTTRPRRRILQRHYSSVGSEQRPTGSGGGVRSGNSSERIPDAPDDEDEDDAEEDEPAQAEDHPREPASLRTSLKRNCSLSTDAWSC